MVKDAADSVANDQLSDVTNVSLRMQKNYFRQCKIHKIAVFLVVTTIITIG